MYRLALLSQLLSFIPVTSQDFLIDQSDFHSTGTAFEGDILITCHQVKHFYDDGTAMLSKIKGTCIDKDIDRRKLRRNDGYLRQSNKQPGNEEYFTTRNSQWTTRGENGKIQVPYEFSATNSLNLWDQVFVKRQLDNIRDESGVVEFVERSGEDSHVNIVMGNHCASHVGMLVPSQPQSLIINMAECGDEAGIQHEFLHTLGMWHEHSRSDRDDYINIIYDNIEPGKDINFQKQRKTQTLGRPYNQSSLMHYFDDAFTKNGDTTLRNNDFHRPNNNIPLGRQRHVEGMSKSDIVQLRLMYQCITGPRELWQYEEHRCSADCKCWEGAEGCLARDEFCQGDLVCIDNACTKSDQ
mmetsp:Transcript_14317/g.18066  ORF Transcript_14317/g.18066 Transcript_14317/m.18066 type:complete len:353 (-) Transcript_14317:4-1062(-)